MRLVLAVSALLIIYIDPSEPDRYVAATYTSLVCYTVYSVILYILAGNSSRLPTVVREWAHWIDVGWYALLVALSSGTSSIFFFGFFFATLFASFRWGFAAGIRVALTSAILFTVIGLATASDWAHFELNRFLLRPAYLLVLGFMMAYWGGFEIELNRRLALLKEVSSYSNPRLGVDHMIASILDRLCSYFEADSCVLVRQDAGAPAYRLHRVDSREARRVGLVQPMTEEMAKLLLAIPDELAVVYNGEERRGWRRHKRYTARDVVEDRPSDEGRTTCDRLASAFEADSLLSVPMRYANKGIGRLYVSARNRAFGAPDLMFLLHVVEHVMPVIENIRLVDRLASTAAEQERQRIARSIHDSVIQPYIGLRMGLSAIGLKLSARNEDVARDIQLLNTIIDDGIANMRSYVHGLRAEPGQGGELIAAVRRFATTFSEASGIDVLVDAGADVRLGDRLASEIFQMIAEGLSNVRRHTRAGRAAIRLAHGDGSVAVEIENDGRFEKTPAGFSPRSIAERAEALGGGVRVGRSEGGATVVRIEIPL